MSVGNISLEKAQTNQVPRRDSNAQFNTIKEEEEIPFHTIDPRNLSPITPSHFQLVDMPDFGDLSAVNHLSKILDITQENVAMDRNFPCGEIILEDG